MKNQMNFENFVILTLILALIISFAPTLKADGADEFELESPPQLEAEKNQKISGDESSDELPPPSLDGIEEEEETPVERLKNDDSEELPDPDLKKDETESDELPVPEFEEENSEKLENSSSSELLDESRDSDEIKTREETEPNEIESSETEPNETELNETDPNETEPVEEVAELQDLSENKTELNAEVKAKPEVKPETPVQLVSEETSAELHIRILDVLRVYKQIALSTTENSPNDIIFYVMPYGCDAEVFLGSREGNRRINAIGALCWNVPMKKSVAFTGSTEKLMPRLGYGIQQYSGQLLASMAIARVPIDYHFPAGWAKVVEEEKLEGENEENFNIPNVPKGKKNFEIRNLVEFEQKNCRWGRDLALTLIGLSYYVEPDVEWESDDGEKWTLERVVQNELEREMKAGESSATNQLLGLLCAIRCRKMRLGEKSITGQYARAENYLNRYRKFILEMQNEMNVWHPKFFLEKGAVPDEPLETLEASGHILRWLVTATPKNELKDERVFKAVQTVTELLEWQLAYWDPGNASGKKIEGIMAALHALTIYEKRAW